MNRQLSPFGKRSLIVLTVLAFGTYLLFFANLLSSWFALNEEVTTLRAQLAQQQSPLAATLNYDQLTICIPGSGDKHPVPLREIVFVAAHNGQTVFHLTNNRQKFCAYGIDRVERELLAGKGFCRVHRKYLINTPQYRYYTPREAKRKGYPDPGKWGIVVNIEYGYIKISEQGRNRCYPKGRPGEGQCEG